MGQLASILPYLGAGAQGYSEGDAQRRRNDTQDLQDKLTQFKLQDATETAGPNPQMLDALGRVDPSFAGMGDPKFSKGDNEKLYGLHDAKMKRDQDEELRKALAEIRAKGMVDAAGKRGFKPVDPIAAGRVAASMDANVQRNRVLLARIRQIARHSPAGAMDSAMLTDPQIAAAWDKYGGNFADVEAAILADIQHSQEATNYYNSLAGMKNVGGGVAPTASAAQAKPVALSPEEQASVDELNKKYAK